MPNSKPFAQDEETGVYLTSGLNQNDFIKVFRQIEKDQANNRQGAKRTLRPKHASRKTVEDLVKLGRRSDGLPYTIKDLKRFDEMRKKFQKRRSGLKGITYDEAVGLANDRRIKRASNRMGDGRDIVKAQFIKLERSNVGHFRVKASARSEYEEHRVKIRFEEWQDELMDSNGTSKGYDLAVKKAVQGRMSIDCSCGDHQYRYRYMATIGGYNLGAAEGAFPKKANKHLEGTACKHVLRCFHMLQSKIWQKTLSFQMNKQARDIGFLNHNLGSTKTFNKEQQAEMSKNRSTNITDRQIEQARAAYAKYEATQRALRNAMKDGKAVKVEELRSQIKRQKKKTDEANAKADKLKAKLAEVKSKQKQDLKLAIRKQATTAVELAMQFGATKEAAINAFAQKSGLSVDAVRKSLDD